jgi:hypothetical protein
MAYVIVTKDAEYFSDLSLQRGAPPKLIWLRIGSCTTALHDGSDRAASPGACGNRGEVHRRWR